MPRSDCGSCADGSGSTSHRRPRRSPWIPPASASAAASSRPCPSTRPVPRAGARARPTSSSSGPRSPAPPGGSASSSSTPASCSPPSSDPSCTSSTGSGVSGRMPPPSSAITATSRGRTARSSGEKTPEYLSCPWAPPMLKLAAPEARAIVLLRDPVERYVSGLSHHDRGGLVDDDESLGRVFGDRMRVVTDAIARGMYATQLEWLQELYPAERLLVLQYERCARRCGRPAGADVRLPGPAAPRAARRGAGSTAQPGQAREGARARGDPRAACGATTVPRCDACWR